MRGSGRGGQRPRGLEIRAGPRVHGQAGLRPQRRQWRRRESRWRRDGDPGSYAIQAREKLLSSLIHPWSCGIAPWGRRYQACLFEGQPRQRDERHGPSWRQVSDHSILWSVRSGRQGTDIETSGVTATRHFVGASRTSYGHWTWSKTPAGITFRTPSIVLDMRSWIVPDSRSCRPARRRFDPRRMGSDRNEFAGRPAPQRCRLSAIEMTVNAMGSTAATPLGLAGSICRVASLFLVQTPGARRAERLAVESH